MKLIGEWQFWAICSAGFAAMTAILGKIGVEDIDSNFATLIRTGVILVFLVLMVVGTNSYQPLDTVSRKTWVFLALSGLATGASWLCYYRALKIGPASGVAPIDKMSVVFVAVLGVALLGERLMIRNWVGIALIALGGVLAAMRA